MDEMDRAACAASSEPGNHRQSDPAVARQRWVQEAGGPDQEPRQVAYQVYTRLSVIEGIKDQVIQPCVRLTSKPGGLPRAPPGPAVGPPAANLVLDSLNQTDSRV